MKLELSWLYLSSGAFSAVYWMRQPKPQEVGCIKESASCQQRFLKALEVSDSQIQLPFSKILLTISKFLELLHPRYKNPNALPDTVNIFKNKSVYNFSFKVIVVDISWKQTHFMKSVALKTHIFYNFSRHNNEYCSIFKMHSVSVSMTAIT